MRIHLRDPETLKQVKPLQLVSYLRGRGWKQAIQGEAAETWTLDREDEAPSLGRTSLEVVECTHHLTEVADRPSHIDIFEHKRPY